MIRNVEQLEDVLSQPSQADVAALAALEGDLLILGVAGKMGPSLAHRARLCNCREISGPVLSHDREGVVLTNFGYHPICRIRS